MMNSLTSVLTLVAAAIGAFASLLGVWMTAYLGRKREHRAAVGEAIVSLINAWSNAYAMTSKNEDAGRTFHGESAVATARLLVLIGSHDQEKISWITHATTNKLNDPSNGYYIGHAQDILLEWHGRRIRNSDEAHMEFEKRVEKSRKDSEINLG